MPRASQNAPCVSPLLSRVPRDGRLEYRRSHMPVCHPQELLAACWAPYLGPDTPPWCRHCTVVASTVFRAMYAYCTPTDIMRFAMCGYTAFIASMYTFDFLYAVQRGLVRPMQVVRAPLNYLYKCRSGPSGGISAPLSSFPSVSKAFSTRKSTGDMRVRGSAAATGMGHNVCTIVVPIAFERLLLRWWKAMPMQERARDLLSVLALGNRRGGNVEATVTDSFAAALTRGAWEVGTEPQVMRPLAIRVHTPVTLWVDVLGLECEGSVHEGWTDVAEDGNRWKCAGGYQISTVTSATYSMHHTRFSAPLFQCILGLSPYSAKPSDTRGYASLALFSARLHAEGLRNLTTSQPIINVMSAHRPARELSDSETELALCMRAMHIAAGMDGVPFAVRTLMRTVERCLPSHSSLTISPVTVYQWRDAAYRSEFLRAACNLARRIVFSPPHLVDISTHGDHYGHTYMALTLGRMVVSSVFGCEVDAFDAALFLVCASAPGGERNIESFFEASVVHSQQRRFSYSVCVQPGIDVASGPDTPLTRWASEAVTSLSGVPVTPLERQQVHSHCYVVLRPQIDVFRTVGLPLPATAYTAGFVCYGLPPDPVPATLTMPTPFPSLRVSFATHNPECHGQLEATRLVQRSVVELDTVAAVDAAVAVATAATVEARDAQPATSAPIVHPHHGGGDGRHGVLMAPVVSAVGVHIAHTPSALQRDPLGTAVHADPSLDDPFRDLMDLEHDDTSFIDSFLA